MSDTRLGPAAELRKLVARARARGMVDIVRLSSDRLVENLSSSETLIVFVRPAAGERRPVEGAALRRAGAEDAERYERDIGTDAAETFARRLSETTRSYVVEAEGRFLHASWIATRAAWTRELRAYFRPPPGDAYVFESFTRSDARGRGIYPFALREICHELSTEGFARLWVAVEVDNPSSLRAVTKAGFEEAWRITYRRRLGSLTVGPPVGDGARVEGHEWITRGAGG
ncbi:MAG: GNAT family N-acetyltransferase [Actinomycetota bacterium]|nr:GNAT family N-acetyltransferase [Actinomycetota bacterium]